jgi:hypothetical protein
MTVVAAQTVAIAFVLPALNHPNAENDLVGAEHVGVVAKVNMDRLEE